MNVYLIKNNIVENVVVVDSMESAQDLFPDYIIVGVADNEAGIGWTYAEGLFAPPASDDTLEQLGELQKAFAIIEGTDEGAGA